MPKTKLEATGNAQNLRIKVNAPALYEIYSGLRGRAYGYLNVQSQPRLKQQPISLLISSVLIIFSVYVNCAYRVNCQRLKIPPTLMKRRPLEQFTQWQPWNSTRCGLLLAGTRQAHILKLEAENKLSKFYVQLAGGLNAQNDWIGQIQKGDI